VFVHFFIWISFQSLSIVKMSESYGEVLETKFD